MEIHDSPTSLNIVLASNTGSLIVASQQAAIGGGETGCILKVTGPLTKDPVTCPGSMVEAGLRE